MYSVFYSSISYLQGRHAFFGKPHFLQVLVLEDQPRTAKSRDLLQLAVQVPRLSVDWSDQKIQRRPHGEMISVLDIHIIYICIYVYILICKDTMIYDIQVAVQMIFVWYFYLKTIHLAIPAI